MTLTKTKKKSFSTTEEIEVTKKMIKAIEDGYGKDKCEGYHPACANCCGQMLLGLLEDHLDLLEYG